jgi:hypothetical protein
MPLDWTDGSDRSLAEARGETIYDQEPDMEPSLEQAMRDLAGDLRRYLTDDVEFIERRLSAIEGMVKEIDDRLAKSRVMAEELGRLATAVERG